MKSRIIIIFYLLIYTLSGKAQSISFLHLTTDDGLPNNSISSIYQDEREFMWFGTRNGIGVYNGKKIKIYQKEKDISNSILYNDIYHITGDRNGHVFIMTNRGISVYDIEKDLFSTITRNNMKAQFFSGYLYAATSKQIFKYNGNKLEPFYKFPDNEGYIRKLYIHNDSILIGSDRGVYILTPQKELTHPITAGNISDIFRDSNGEYWITASSGHGLYRIQGEQIDRFQCKEEDPTTISSNFTHRCCEDTEGNIWIGTFNGLNKYDKNTGEFYRYFKQEHNKSLSHSSIWGLYCDKQGTIWIGTYSGGINYFNPQKQIYREYQASSKEEEGLSSPIIGRMLEDCEGNLWICTERGGINKYNPATRTYKRYLHFDAWASTFGETVTAIELSPEGTGYRAKTRFAKFYNLPELMAMFKETADIQTADMLKLPVPEAHYHSVVLKPSETQKEMVASLSERAERVRNKMVDSSVDNMLLITNDGRKLALDQRLMNDMLPDSETSKVGACAENVFDIWQRTADRKSTQMVFCDLSTPHGDGKFNVYDDLRNKLIAKGVPAEEIAYIHTANSEAQKKELFGKVRSGQVRVLIGSTQKMGAGTNVQTKLAALHHLDCPWRPSDLQQREGRIIRQGNENKEVDIYTYVTENTFDSYLYQLVESKQKFIGQIMTSKSPVRSAEDIDETALSYAEIKALCAGNPHIKEKMDLDIDVTRLKLLKANHLSQRYSLEDQILKEFPQKIKSLEQRIEGYRADIDQRKRNTEPNEDGFSPMFMPGGTVREKKAAGDAILGLCKSMTSPNPIPIGQYRGFDMELSFDTFSREYKITLIHQLRHTVTLGTDIFGNIQRLDNTLGAFEERMAACAEQLENTRVQLENAKAEVHKPFSQEEELAAKTARLNELNALLNLDKTENEIVDGERGEEEPQRTSSDRER